MVSYPVLGVVLFVSPPDICFLPYFVSYDYLNNITRLFYHLCWIEMYIYIYIYISAKVPS